MLKQLLLLLIFISIYFAGCNKDSDVASSNISKQSDMFQIQRRIILKYL